MCGNQPSIIHQPSQPIDSSLRSTIVSQLAHNKIQIKNQPIKPDDAIAFQRFNTFNVRQLQIQNCKLNQQSLEGILFGNWSNLKRINKNQIGMIGCRHLAQSSQLHKITTLELNSNKIKDMGLTTLLDAHFPNILDLSISDNHITKNVIPKLAKFTQLQCINLGQNKLDDQSIELIKQLQLPNMVYLKLSQNVITDNGLRSLLNNMQNLKALEVAMMDRNKIKVKPNELKINRQLFLFY